MLLGTRISARIHAALARNFSDRDRYNMLPIIAEKLGLDCSETMTLWQDLALVELNVAVLHSYKKHGVRILDHHALTASFMQFMDDEQKCGRHVYGDRIWLIPPISASTTPVYTVEFENRLLKPNYFYQRDPWQNDIPLDSLCRKLHSDIEELIASHEDEI